MSLAIGLFLLALCFLASAIFSGGETGIYMLSRVRVDLEAQQGSRAAARIRRMLADPSGLLITLLIANNIANQATTYVGQDILAQLSVPMEAREVVLAVLLTPVLFVLGELLPKDLFRRRPHAMVGAITPVLVVTRVVTYPLGLLLRWVVRFVEKTMGLRAGDLTRVRNREEQVLELLREHENERRRMERMVRNVLGLRSLRVEGVMVPWARVHTLDRKLTPEQAYAALAVGPNTRFPVRASDGGVEGYVHQLEVLAAGPGTDPFSHLRPLPAFAPGLPLDRALARLQAEGHRMALVGTPEKPLGLLTVKDLVEEISGELARW